MTPESAPCPYVGLQPFREEDCPYFFGRERDIRVISSNLREQPLTVVYGASGVGKSSILRAGVLPYLRSDTEAVAVYFNAWQSETFLETLQERCRAALNQPDAPLDKLVAAQGRRLFLLLDQFEELLLYHQAGGKSEQFDSLLARLVNRDDVAVNVLIGIREDSLSRFDQRFSIRIADLLANTLPLEHLNYHAARRAIIEPLRVFNERHGLGENGYSMETDLAEEILREVQPRQYAEDDGGTVGVAHGRVETPFLQMVLRRLWEEETKTGSRMLRLDTLTLIGGARQIVEKHVNEVLANLPRDADREIAACMFRYLVTPSRSKIAQDMESLIGYGEASETEVRSVLSWLSDRPESRILRRLDTPERYEMFHDVLAQPILDWRKNHFAEKDRIEEARKRRRLLFLAGCMTLLAVAAAGLAFYAFDQRRKAHAAADLALIEHGQTIAANNDAQAARAQAVAFQAELRAGQAELAGRKEEAARQWAIADAAKKQVQDHKNAAEAARNDAGYILAGIKGEATPPRTVADDRKNLAPDLKNAAEPAPSDASYIKGAFGQLLGGAFDPSTATRTISDSRFLAFRFPPPQPGIPGLSEFTAWVSPLTYRIYAISATGTTSSLKACLDTARPLYLVIAEKYGKSSLHAHSDGLGWLLTQSNPDRRIDLRCDPEGKLVLNYIDTASHQTADDEQRELNQLQSDYAASKYDAILPRLRELAEHGNLWSQTLLGLMYRKGQGVAKDDQKAEDYYKGAAQQGWSNAQYNLGTYYLSQSRLREAETWLLKAAEQGEFRAELNLGQLYLKKGALQSEEKSFTWFLRGAEHGDAEAQYNTCYDYADGLGVTRDMVEAYRWCYIAAQNGQAAAGRNRDHLGQQMQPADVARARAAAERWLAQHGQE